MTEFDYEEWAAQGRSNRDKLPSGVAEALGPERDWADVLVDDMRIAFVERWPTNAVASLFRSRCRPIGNDTVTGLVFKLNVAAKVFDTVRTSDAQDALFNAGHAKLLREAITALKATQ